MAALYVSGAVSHENRRRTRRAPSACQDLPLAQGPTSRRGSTWSQDGIRLLAASACVRVFRELSRLRQSNLGKQVIAETADGFRDLGAPAGFDREIALVHCFTARNLVSSFLMLLPTTEIAVESGSAISGIDRSLQRHKVPRLRTLISWAKAWARIGGGAGRGHLG